jgi:hypothetical protein
MSIGRIGGALVAVGGLLGILAVAIAALGGQIRWAEACWQWSGCDRQSGGATGVEHLIGPATLAVLGVGTVVLALAGTGPADRGGTRVGLAVLGLGLASYVFATNLPIPEGTNTAQSLPIIFGLLIGAMGTLVGLLLTALSLVRRPGRPRSIGSLVLAGMLGFPVGALIAGVSPDDRLTSTVGALVALAGGLSLFGGFVALGLTAWQEDASRSSAMA